MQTFMSWSGLKLYRYVTCQDGGDFCALYRGVRVEVRLVYSVCDVANGRRVEIREVSNG